MPIRLRTALLFVKLVILACLLTAGVTPGQSTITNDADVVTTGLYTPGDSLPQPLKIGLVLSGGGAKGFAHVGALKVIEEAGIEVDYISGTSMGSIIGGLYASGFTADQLDSLARAKQWQQLFSERTQRRLLTTYEKKINEKFLLDFPISQKGIQLPQGLISGQNVYEFLSRQTSGVHHISNFDSLPIPFRAVATNLETGEAAVLDHGHLPDAIRASISIPSVFIPYQIGENVYVDGGLTRNLPVQEVLDMGANFVISVDVGEPLKDFEELESLLDILNQAVLLHANKVNKRQQKLSNIPIEPPLDTLKTYELSDFDKATELVEFGEWMTRPYFDKLQSVAEQQTSTHKQSGRTKPLTEKYSISSIEINGAKNLTRDFIVTELKLNLNQPVTLGRIHTAVNRLYGTGFFETISYNLEEKQNTYILELTITEERSNKVSAGFRFDTEREAAVIFNATLQNIFNTPSLTQANIRLGERIFTNLEYISTPGNRPRFGLKADLSYLRDDITWFENEERISSFVSHNYRADLFAGLLLNNTIEAGVGIRQDFFNMGQELNTRELPFDEENFFSIYGRFWLDTYDQLHFPTTGQSFLIEYNIAELFNSSSPDFTRQLFYGDWIFPAGNNFSFNVTTFIGRSTGSELPQPYWFNFTQVDRSLRTDRFVGYEDDEDAAKNMFMLGGGLQYQFSFNKYAILSGNIGNRFNKWTGSELTRTNLSGVGIGLGADTIIGAVKLTASVSERNDLFVRLDIGYRF